MKIDLDALHARLARIETLRGLVRGDLRPMAVKGIVHDHIRLVGRGLIVRAPRYSAWGMPPDANLDYQAACFRRAWPSGHTPRLAGVLEPGADLPDGALVVEEIVGRAPRLPDDFEAMAKALARIHGLGLAPEPDRPPLVYHRDPVAGILQRIETQAENVERADIAPAARQAIFDELDWARHFAVGSHGLEQPVCLVVTDTHPGNFIVTSDGRAVFVDLEKAMYGAPGIDLAHASLYTSVNWDPDCARDLGIRDTARLYRTYLAEIDRATAVALRPWFTPMRRLTWLRTTTWAAAFRAGAPLPEVLPDRLRGWIEGRLRDYFDPATIARIRAEWLGDEPLDSIL